MRRANCFPWLLLLSFSAILQGPAAGADYVRPLKRFSGCTSLFGDYRPGRYHAGLDFRTDGQVGWPVVAVGDGYIQRAATSYFGYGKVIYLALDDGRVAVYGHLDEFGPQVTERITAEQRLTRRYHTNLYFKENELRVRRGTVIARSGETGAGAPHLHFELRAPGNKPLNPEWEGFSVTDRRDPEIAALWVIPQYERGLLGLGPGGVEAAPVQLSGGPHAPLEPADGPVLASGPVGFAVEAYDRKPNSDLRHNITGLSLVVRGDTVFAARFDTLDYETMDQIRLERVLWLDPGGDVYALYKSHGNELAHSRVHARHPNGFVLVAPGDTSVPFEIVVTDANLNRRTIRGRLTYSEPELLFGGEPAEPVVIRARSMEFLPERARGLWADLEARGLGPQIKSMSPVSNQVCRLFAADAPDSGVWLEGTEPVLSQTTVLKLAPGVEQRFMLPDSSLEVTIPLRSVYEPQFLTVRTERLPDGNSVWHLGPEDILLRTPITLSFAAPADELQDLFSFGDSSNKLSFVENRRRDGRIVCRAGGRAAYTFATDSMPPTIRRLRPAEDAVVSRNALITAQLEDDLSGVGNDTMITVRVDGEWLVPEFDPETRRLVARPFAPWTPGTHALEVEVYDWAGNVGREKRTFQVK